MNIIIGFILSKIFWFLSKEMDYMRSPNSCATLQDWYKK